MFSVLNDIFFQTSESANGSVSGKDSSQHNNDEPGQSSTPSLLSDLQLHSTEVRYLLNLIISTKK